MSRIDILCSDPAHPVNLSLERWAETHATEHDVAILRDRDDLRGGDFLFLISCHQIIGKSHRARYRHALVIHASDLPQGRGWSPMIWDVLAGADQICVSLLNAEDEVDSGAIWQKRRFSLDGTELLAELNAKLFEIELELMDWALVSCDQTQPEPQTGEPTFYPKRTPEAQEIDPLVPLADSFDLIRIADPERFPAYFSYRGATYTIRLEKKP